MKSRDRCKHHTQGDRCMREDGHKGEHASHFHIWGRGTNGKVLVFPESDIPRVVRKLMKQAAGN